jgi:hypothetical protein
MKRALAALLVLTIGAQSAAADPHKMLVLLAEGRADAATRTKIDGAVLKLAKASEAQVTPGDITYSDAAAAVGCNPDDRACKDEVLGMLAVDEIVFTTVTPKPGGFEVAVHRVTKGNASRDAQMMVATGQPADHLDGIAALFSTMPTTPGPAEPTTPAGPPLAGPPQPLPGPVTDAPPPAPLQPRDEPDDHSGRRRLEIVGMAGGGTMLLLSLVLWGQASNLQGQIDNAPKRTHADLAYVADLENSGDAFAAWGNVMFIGGAIVGGISGYYFWKDRSAQRSRIARITPTVFDHGAGIALTLGGSP